MKKNQCFTKFYFRMAEGSLYLGHNICTVSILSQFPRLITLSRILLKYPINGDNDSMSLTLISDLVYFPLIFLRYL